MSSADIKETIAMVCFYAFMAIMFVSLTQSGKPSKSSQTDIKSQIYTHNKKTVWDKALIVSKVIGGVAALIYAISQAYKAFL
ncbi:MAG TPA: hypothetical protein VK783_05640 [Bacteroidia bacterium]|nr:hypothetical protein [Bacteroidia bacterium]